MWYIMGTPLMTRGRLVLDYYNKSGVTGLCTLGCVHIHVVHILLNGTWTAARGDADRSHPLSRLQFFLNTILSLLSLTP